MTEKYCAFNMTRESFLSFGIEKADTVWMRLRGLLGRRKFPPDTGLWIMPSHGVHTIGVLFPIDVVYLDKDDRVVQVIPSLAPFKIAPIHRSAVSVMELPVGSVTASQTQKGDLLLIGLVQQMAEYFSRRQAPAAGPENPVKHKAAGQA